MASTKRVVTVDAETDIAKLLDEMGADPFVLKRNGATWLVVPDEDAFDPEAALEALNEAIGGWKDLVSEGAAEDVRRARELGSRPMDRP